MRVRAPHSKVTTKSESAYVVACLGRFDALESIPDPTPAVFYHVPFFALPPASAMKLHLLNCGVQVECVGFLAALTLLAVSLGFPVPATLHRTSLSATLFLVAVLRQGYPAPAVPDVFVLGLVVLLLVALLLVALLVALVQG